MGLFDRKPKAPEKPPKPDTPRADFKPVHSKEPRADFSNVRSGSSSTAAAPAASSQTYTVESGDTLWKIAERFYGSGSEWPRIHEANRDKVQNPDLIQPGWVLTIPPREGGRS